MRQNEIEKRSEAPMEPIDGAFLEIKKENTLVSK
jgi:hypothetical protein